MDPLAHTLVGAALAETGLKRLSRYATACLLIGANIADLDAVAHLWGDDTALYLRRGWSHGVLALAVLPLLLAGTLWLWHRWRGARNAAAPPFRLSAIVGLSFLAVWTHPLLDWLNTYGIRLLMPFDGRWFYGDTLFIIDPWIWLLAGAGVVLTRSRSVPAIAGWTLLAALASTLILTTDRAPLAVKLIWLAGLAAVAALRWRKPSPAASRTLARASLATLLIYVCAVYGMARMAESAAAARFPGAWQAQANPSPGVPFKYRVLLVHDQVYRVITPSGETFELPRQEPDAVVRRALATESIRGFVNWMRFPYWRVEPAGEGWLVRFWDLRYQRPDQPHHGIGYVEVLVPGDALGQQTTGIPAATE